MERAECLTACEHTASSLAWAWAGVAGVNRKQDRVGPGSCRHPSVSGGFMSVCVFLILKEIVRHNHHSNL